MKRYEAEALARSIQATWPELAARVFLRDHAVSPNTVAYSQDTNYWLLCIRPFVDERGFTSFEMFEVRTQEGWYKLQSRMSRSVLGNKVERAAIKAEMLRHIRPTLIEVYSEAA